MVEDAFDQQIHELPVDRQVLIPFVRECRHTDSLTGCRAACKYCVTNVTQYAGVTVLRAVKENAAAEFSHAVSNMDRRIERHLLTRGRVRIVGLSLCAAAAFVVVYAKYGLSNTLSVSSDRLTLSTVSEAGFVEYIPITGNVVPGTTIYLDAIEGGQVTEVNVEEGAQVVSGQPLVKLKNSRQELEVMRLEAELTQQLNQLSTAKLSFAQASLQHEREIIDVQAQIDQLQMRQRRRLLLRDSGAVARADIEDGDIELARYRHLLEALNKARAMDMDLQGRQVARIEQAITSLTANLKLARDSLASLSVIAPISGQLSVLSAHLGESKNAGQRIGQIDALDDSKVAAQVDEFYLPRVRLGQTATAKIDDVDVALRMTKIYPEVRDRQFKVDLQFADPAPPTIRFGQSLQLRLELDSVRNALQVQNGPFYDHSSEGVFVVNASGSSAERRTVRFGRKTTDAIEVIEGLSPGERIVTSSYESFAGVTRLRLH